MAHVYDREEKPLKYWLHLVLQAIGALWVWAVLVIAMRGRL